MVCFNWRVYIKYPIRANPEQSGDAKPRVPKEGRIKPVLKDSRATEDMVSSVFFKGKESQVKYSLN